MARYSEEHRIAVQMHHGDAEGTPLELFELNVHSAPSASSSCADAMASVANKVKLKEIFILVLNVCWDDIYMQ